jgi:hypothetical protein
VTRERHGQDDKRILGPNREVVLFAWVASEEVLRPTQRPYVSGGTRVSHFSNAAHIRAGFARARRSVLVIKDYIDRHARESLLRLEEPVSMTMI